MKRTCTVVPPSQTVIVFANLPLLTGTSYIYRFESFFALSVFEFQLHLFPYCRGLESSMRRQEKQWNDLVLSWQPHFYASFGRLFQTEMSTVEDIFIVNPLFSNRRSGDRIPVEARFSAPVPTGPGAEVKERVDLHLYSPLARAFVECCRVSFTISQLIGLIQLPIPPVLTSPPSQYHVKSTNYEAHL